MRLCPRSHSSDCNCRAPGPTSSERFSSHQRVNLSAKTHIARQQGQRKPRQMLENWRRRDLQDFASENRARCKLRDRCPRESPQAWPLTEDKESRRQAVKTEGSRLRPVSAGMIA